MYCFTSPDLTFFFTLNPRRRIKESMYLPFPFLLLHQNIFSLIIWFFGRFYYNICVFHYKLNFWCYQGTTMFSKEPLTTCIHLSVASLYMSWLLSQVCFPFPNFLFSPLGSLGFKLELDCKNFQYLTISPLYFESCVTVLLDVNIYGICVLSFILVKFGWLSI